MNGSTNVDADRTATVQDRPTHQELIVAGVVVVGALAGAVIAGPGFAVLVLTLASVAAALWLAYSVPQSTPRN